MDAKSQQISKAMRCKGCQSTRLNRNCVVVASLLVDVLLFIIRVIWSEWNNIFPSVNTDRYSRYSTYFNLPAENSYMINICVSYNRLLRLLTMILNTNMVSHRLWPFQIVEIRFKFTTTTLLFVVLSSAKILKLHGNILSVFLRKINTKYYITSIECSYTIYIVVENIKNHIPVKVHPINLLAVLKNITVTVAIKLNIYYNSMLGSNERYPL